MKTGQMLQKLSYSKLPSESPDEVWKTYCETLHTCVPLLTPLFMKIYCFHSLCIQSTLHCCFSEWWPLYQSHWSMSVLLGSFPIKIGKIPAVRNQDNFTPTSEGSSHIIWEHRPLPLLHVIHSRVIWKFKANFMLLSYMCH